MRMKTVGEPKTRLRTLPLWGAPRGAWTKHRTAGLLARCPRSEPNPWGHGRRLGRDGSSRPRDVRTGDVKRAKIEETEKERINVVRSGTDI